MSLRPFESSVGTHTHSSAGTECWEHSQRGREFGAPPLGGGEAGGIIKSAPATFPGKTAASGKYSAEEVNRKKAQGVTA